LPVRPLVRTVRCGRYDRGNVAFVVVDELLSAFSRLEGVSVILHAPCRTPNVNGHAQVVIEPSIHTLWCCETCSVEQVFRGLQLDVRRLRRLTEPRNGVQRRYCVPCDCIERRP